MGTRSRLNCDDAIPGTHTSKGECCPGTLSVGDTLRLSGMADPP